MAFTAIFDISVDGFISVKQKIAIYFEMSLPYHVSYLIIILFIIPQHS